MGEIVEIDRILKGQGDPSPIGLESGLDTMLVIAAAHRSAATGRTVSIDYTKGYGPQSLMPGGSPC